MRDEHSGEAVWRRPESVPFPSEWRRYTGPRAMPDGRRPEFWIQDVPEERFEEVVDFMCESFLDEENMCKTTGVKEDPVSLEEIRQLWRAMLQYRIGLLALTNWPDGMPRIAGCNVTGVMHKDEHLMEVKGEPVKKVVQGLHYIESQVDVWSKYGVTECMTALGLSVAPEFRGQDLGVELLRARSDLGRAVGLRLTITVFTGIASQKQSSRAGFEVLARAAYEDYKGEDGKVVFPNATCKYFEFKAKELE